MQVIRHGTKWNDEFPKQNMCKKCKCVFLYEKKDIKEQYYENLHSPPPMITQDYLYCPECGEKIILY